MGANCQRASFRKRRPFRGRVPSRKTNLLSNGFCGTLSSQKKYETVPNALSFFPIFSPHFCGEACNLQFHSSRFHSFLNSTVFHFLPFPPSLFYVPKSFNKWDNPKGRWWRKEPERKLKTFLQTDLMFMGSSFLLPFFSPSFFSHSKPGNGTRC